MHVKPDVFTVLLFYQYSLTPQSGNMCFALPLLEKGGLCGVGGLSARGWGREDRSLVGLGNAMGGWAFLGIGDIARGSIGR